MNQHSDSNPLRGPLGRAVSEVLHYIWDPIEIAGLPQARDEYETYVPAVLAMLLSGASETEISLYLQKLAEERMGLSKVSERANDAALTLVEWRSHLSESHA